LWTSLPDVSKEYLNKRWYEYTGLSLEEGKGWGWKVVVHSGDLDRLIREWLALVEARKPGELETRIRRYDGEYRWFLIRVVPQLDAEGNLVRWFGSNTDIEDRKRAENKLLEEERELRRITDAIPQTIVVQDPSGNTLYANQAALDYIGLTREAVVTSDFRARIIHPEDLERLRGDRQAALARGLPFEIEQRTRRKDGPYRWFPIRYNPLRDEQGRPGRSYATGTDIDDRKRGEDRTRNDNVALREDIVRSSMFEEIVGSSEPLRKLKDQVSKVAPTDSTVLVLGETGTGKELIARAIHNRSKRSNRAFTPLIASELFGHEKASFMGATQRRLGRFESAERGNDLPR
jgi:formate hydrogenlyase transcriptional activator